MTNREVETDSTSEARLAALLAVHLVSQVLEEAYVIANAASESGQSRRYLTMLKNTKSGMLGDVEEEISTFIDSKEESIETFNIMRTESEIVSHVVATSTPQKVTDELQKISNNTSLIGQGDEEFTSLAMHQNDYDTSTSMFINNLFDMSEVERVFLCDETSNEDHKDLLTNAMATIINTALGIALNRDIVNTEPLTGAKSQSPENSAYSLLANAICTADLENTMGDVAFSVDDNMIECNNDIASSSVVVSEITKDKNEEMKKEDSKNNVAHYENAYLTLNRDYEQCSEDDDDPVLQDPKGMLMQEVELITLQTSDDTSVKNEIEQQENQQLKATSAVSASVSSRKSSLVHRCRSQGARILACLRGWWRRKTPGKRKEARIPGSVRGICPLSPGARRRAASLLDQRRLCSSPTSTQHVVWKFNTVSEALVNSNRWKDYTFDVNSDKCGEH